MSPNERDGPHIVSESNTNVSNKLFTPVTFSEVSTKAIASTSYGEMSFFGMRLEHVFIYYKFLVSCTTTHIHIQLYKMFQIGVCASVCVQV